MKKIKDKQGYWPVKVEVVKHMEAENTDPTDHFGNYGKTVSITTKAKLLVAQAIETKDEEDRKNKLLALAELLMMNVEKFK